MLCQKKSPLQRFVKWSKPPGRAHICHKYHKLYFWRKIVIWKNFGKFWEILGDFATIYALLCGEKLSPKSTFVEKNDKYEVCHQAYLAPPLWSFAIMWTQQYIFSGCTPLPAMNPGHFQNIKDDVYCFIGVTLKAVRLKSIICSFISWIPINRKWMRH